MTQPLSDDWRDWLRLNLRRGCALDEMYQRAADQGFDPNEISSELGGYRPVDTPPSDGADGEPWFSLYHAPITKASSQPRAWRLDTGLAQLYEVPELLSPEECVSLIKVIDTSLSRSTVTVGPADYRTSRTCHMRAANPDLMSQIDARIAGLIGCDPSFSEPIQGQRYDVGEYFKAHTDWFTPDTKEFETHTNSGGQRTWTVMIYLNAVAAGGSTRFERIGRTFNPVPGLAVAWNNLGLDGVPNVNVLHEAQPVLSGSKYVITKWFREQAGLNA